MAFDPNEQRRIMGHFATGVTVVTTRLGQILHGMTANAVTSLSLDPPLVLVAIGRDNQMYELLPQSRIFALNILRRDQEDLSNRFAVPGPKDFSDLSLTTAATGAPLLQDTLGWVDCNLTEVLPGGDHDIFIGEIAAGDAHSGSPLLYYGGQYTQLSE
ncbi:MAG: flavin reductase [Candidatus Latescibacteria bacterium]|nr:flavin reductase [Candidatus Latescibacterota bacterium]